MDGREARPKDSVKCPTMAWQWEGNWTVETNFEGKTLEKDVRANSFFKVLQQIVTVNVSLQGWTYAVDFPSDYKASKGFTSCVRRRKWVRYRRYVATESWSAVPPIHKDVSEVKLKHS